MGRLPANPPTNLTSPLKSPKRVKPDIRQVIFGDLLFPTWYPSFYPDAFIGSELDRLYVCQWCFKYTKQQHLHLGHLRVCDVKLEGLPGRPIYQEGSHSIYEVDGEEEQLFSQNLSLFAKLFLDNKSVFFDVASFNYYLLLHRSSDSTADAAPQIVGFFSKEKMSWDNNNLACILVFPPWQRKGLGKILMGASYELSKREGRYGGPERPLSELGRRGYMQFWEARLARTILGMKSKSAITVNELAKLSWILPDDVIGSLKRMEVLDVKANSGKVLITKNAVRAWAARTQADLTPPVSERGFLEGG